MALVFKALEDDEDDIGVRYSNATVGQDEECSDEYLIRLNDIIKEEIPEPLHGDELEEVRLRRQSEKQLWSMIQESLFYFLFFLLICFIVWGTRNPLLFHSNLAIRNEISGGINSYFLTKVSDGHKFWNWSRTILIDNLFYMEQYNGEPGTPRDRQYLLDGSNVRVGPLFMRQVRVKPDSCVSLATIVQADRQCKDRYNLLNEETRQFTVKWQLVLRDNYSEDNSTRVEKSFKYKSFAELKTIPYWGRFATYGGGGYVANLGITKGQASELLKELLDNNWFDHYTRAVFVEFTVYNPNINMFSHAKFLLESPAIGAVLTSAKVSSFQLFTRLSGMTLFVVSCQVIYMILTLSFMIRESLKFRRLGNDYWKDPWNYVEVIVICLSWATLAIYLIQEAVGRHVLKTLMENKDQYLNIALFVYYDEVLWSMIGCIVFMVNIKFLKLLRFNKHIAHFAGTLVHATKDLSSFSVMFLLFFTAFASWAYLSFSEYEEQFNTIIGVYETLFAMLIGKFDGKSLTQSHKIMGPIFFSAFGILIFFILINMFLAIIGSAYHEVLENPDVVSDDYKVVKTIMQKLTGYLGLRRESPQCNKPIYIGPLESLNLHLEALDRMVTEECREILDWERQEK